MSAPGCPALVVGMAVTGSAVARHLLAAGTPVLAVDDRPTEETRRRAAELGVPLVESPTPERLAELAAGASMVVVSPGVPGHHPALRLPLPVVSEIELAGREAIAAEVTLVAVTGTNGKTTVTTQVAQILEASGRRVVAAGNIGTPLLDAVAARPEVVVAEVSSFQLALTETFRPRVATWLNLTEDHLDWHGSLEHYTDSKARVWSCQGPGDVAVANADDPVVMARASGAPAGSVLTFGLLHGADYAEVDGWLVGPGGARIMAVGELWRGLPQDRANALAACATAISSGATVGACRQVLSRFSGLHHRVELVGEAGGVRFYDDSKATTPASVLAALAGFDSVVLIAGGRNKGLDLGSLRSGAGRLRAAVAIGEAAGEVEEALEGAVARIERAGSMAEAVERAASMARPGDAVLLSPGCASFDWYGSYAERGRDYARAVARAIEDREVVG